MGNRIYIAVDRWLNRCYNIHRAKYSGRRIETELRIVKIMKTIQITLPDEILISMKDSREIRMAAAAKLYEIGKLSSGRAAELAGVSRVSFLQMLARYKVPIFNPTAEELEQDLHNA